MPSYFSLKIRTNITIIFELGHQSALSPQETSPPKYEKAGFQHRLERILCFFEKLRRPAIKPGPRSYLLLSPSPTPVPHTPTNVFRQPGKSLPPSRSPCPGPIQHMGKNRVTNLICNPVLLFCGKRGIRTFPETRRISVCCKTVLLLVHRIAHSRLASFYPVFHLVRVKIGIIR